MIFALLALAILSGARAEGSAPESKASISLEQAMDAAERGAAKVLAAERALADALEARSDSAAWKGARLSVDGSYAGDLSPSEPAGPGAQSDPYAVSASLSLPVLSNLSLSASARLGGLVSGSVAWSPLAASQTSADAAFRVFKAQTALDSARWQARLDAMAAFMQVLSTEAALEAASVSLTRAVDALALSEQSSLRGELGAAALARSRAAVPRAQAALNKARLQAGQARDALAELVGPPLSAEVEAGVALNAESMLSATEEAWAPPAERQPGASVLDAREAVAMAERSGVFAGSGPVSLKGNLSSDGSFGISGTIALDWDTASGSALRSRDRAIADARSALDDALKAEAAAWKAALSEAETARLTYEEAKAQLAAAEADLAQSAVLYRLGELTADALAADEEAAAKARLDLVLARIQLAKARLALR